MPRSDIKDKFNLNEKILEYWNIFKKHEGLQLNVNSVSTIDASGDLIKWIKDKQYEDALYFIVLQKNI